VPKSVDIGWEAFYFDCNAIAVVEDMACQTQFDCQSVHKGTESYSLNDPLDYQTLALDFTNPDLSTHKIRTPNQ